MGKPDSAADPVLPVANTSVSNTANLTSSLKRARATGLDPGTALSSSFDFLNEHRLGIKVVAPEDRMEAMGDDHDQPNGDLEFCGAHGLLVREASSESWLE